MGRDPAEQPTPDLFSTGSVRDASPPPKPRPTEPAADTSSQRHVLPKNSVSRRQANSVTENWTSFLRWRSMRQNGEADCRGVLEQNPHCLDAHLTYRSPSVSAVASGLLAKTPYLAALAPIAPAFRPNARAPAFAPNRNKTKKKLAKRRPAGSSGSVCWRSASAPPRTRETCVPLR